MARALITGGTSGIGAAFARALAAQGSHLVLVARDQERLTAVGAELAERYGVSVETLAADLADRADLARAADRLGDDAQPIDLLVNNAGFALRVPLSEEHLPLHEHAVDVMIRAVLVLGATAGEAMRRRGRGRIINVSSTSGFMALGGYSAIKAWVITFSESLAVELAGSGVTVTALCPGWVRTEFHDRAGLNTTRIPAALWLDPDAMVAEGLARAERGQVICIPSKRYQAIMFLVRRVLPRSAVRAVSRRLTAGRR